MGTPIATIERIIITKLQNGYTAAEGAPEGRAYPGTAVGDLLGGSLGERLRLSDEWTIGPCFGGQF